MTEDGRSFRSFPNTKVEVASVHIPFTVFLRNSFISDNFKKENVL